jgi:phosphopantetheinyl transferase
MEIYRADMSAFALEACFPFLSVEERLRAESLDGAARRRFVVSRALRRCVLGQDAEILVEENGRPCLKGNPAFFSMSHTGDVFVIAVDIHPIGIDAEIMKERGFAKLSHWFFKERIPDREDFYRRWTQYEASLKLAGLSLFSKDVPAPEHICSEIMDNFMLSAASNHEIGFPLLIKTLLPSAI